MIQLSIKMLPESGSNQYAYNFANLLVQVKVGRDYRLKDDYSFMVYSESKRLMAIESTWKQKIWHQAWRSGRTFSMTMCGETVWMPGKYFFLMVPKNEGYAIRIDLELDDKCCFIVGEYRRCGNGSDEDILARQALDEDPCHRPSRCRTEMPWLEIETLDEVVDGFFSHPYLMGYSFTPAAVDKVCRLLAINAQRGPSHLCSKHYYASIVYEKIAGRLNEYLIDVNDIDEERFLD